MADLRWTFTALACLGGTAAADSAAPSAVDTASDSVSVQGSYRGVAEDYLVMPRGGELSAQMRFITADAPASGPRDALKFTDLALFGISGRWSLFSKLELGASVDLLPKQPSDTDEKPWQSVGFSLKSPLGRHIALTVSGGGGHLMNHTGKWTHEALTLEFKKPIDPKFLALDIQAGVNGLGLDAPSTTSSAFLTEVAVSTTALFHEPSGHWGAWLGIGYAVPVQASGRDPTTEMKIDPQPRLNFHAGTVLSLVPKWDLFVDLGVIDRGELADSTTRLPILDGGFDQTQIIFGITRHIEVKPKAPEAYDGDGENMRLGSL
jgi:hypothetical protein